MSLIIVLFISALWIGCLNQTEQAMRNADRLAKKLDAR
jgi:hypothetical protein